MKKVLCMAAVALLTASCSNNEENIPVPEEKIDAVAIEITQKVKGVVTKAPVTSGNQVTATVVMVDAAGTTANWAGFTPVTSNTVTGGTFSDDAHRANVSTASFTAGATQAVTLAPSLYYPVVTSNNHAHIAAVAPKGTVDGETVVIPVQDGEQDVMYAASTDAGTSGSATPSLNLEFDHLTTQLNFKVKLTAAASNGAWNSKASVKSITIQEASLPKAVAYATGDVTWTNAANLLVPNASNVAFNTTAVAVGNSVMIQSAGKVTVNVVITGGDGKDYAYDNVVIMKESNQLVTTAGHSHEITLTVTEPSEATGPGVTRITTTATVKDWVPGDTGSGNLQ